MVRTESLRTNRHDTGSTTARSVDELALIRDTIRHYAPVLIAPLSIQIRRAGVQKKFVGPHLGMAKLETTKRQAAAGKDPSIRAKQAKSSKVSSLGQPPKHATLK